MSEPKKPREFWIKEAKSDRDRLCCDYEPEPEGGEIFVHVREVLDDEVVLTREEWAKVNAVVEAAEKLRARYIGLGDKLLVFREDIDKLDEALGKKGGA